MTSYILLKDAEKEERKRKRPFASASVFPAEPDGDDCPTMPRGYTLTDQGLIWSDPNDPDLPPILVASAFDVVAETSRCRRHVVGCTLALEGS